MMCTPRTHHQRREETRRATRREPDRGASPRGSDRSASRQLLRRTWCACVAPSLAMSKHTILFLAANPRGSDPLALDREAREIHVELERSGYRDQFEFVTRWAVEPLDLLRE